MQQMKKFGWMIFDDFRTLLSLSVLPSVVMPLLKTLLEQQDSPAAVRLQALKCFSSWVQLKVPLNDIDPITEMLFQLLQDPELFDLCIDSLINVVCQPIAFK